MIINRLIGWSLKKKTMIKVISCWTYNLPFREASNYLWKHIKLGKVQTTITSGNVRIHTYILELVSAKWNIGKKNAVFAEHCVLDFVICNEVILHQLAGDAAHVPRGPTGSRPRRVLLASRTGRVQARHVVVLGTGYSGTDRQLLRPTSSTAAARSTEVRIMAVTSTRCAHVPPLLLLLVHADL
jgi:hypothetical protein